MKRVAIFPGSFDPFTNGHEDIVLRGLGLFDEIIIAIGYNSEKNSRYIAIDKMVALIRETFKKYPNISVQTSHCFFLQILPSTLHRFVRLCLDIS